MLKTGALRVVTGVALVMIYGGCVESALNPSDTVRVSGKALQSDGTPLANAPVVLARGKTSVCVFTETFQELTTDSAGNYTAELQGSDTQQGDNALCFRAYISKGPGGSSSSAEFLMQVTEVAVPELRYWNSELAAAAEGDGVSVTYKGTEATHAFTAPVGMKLGEQPSLAWRHLETTSPTVFTAEQLEDFPELRVSASTYRSEKGSGTTFGITYHSGYVDIAPGTLVPASRGATCTFGATTFEGETPCPYTDGKLGENLQDAPELRLTLASAKILKKAIVRGFSVTVGDDVQVVIEGSSDGGLNWTELARESAVGEFAEIALSSTTPAVKDVRVRVEGMGEPRIHALREISLFE